MSGDLFNIKMVYFANNLEPIQRNWSPFQTSEDELMRYCPYDNNHRQKITNDPLQQKWNKHLKKCRDKYHKGELNCTSLDNLLGKIIYCKLGHPVRAGQFLTHRTNCEFAYFRDYVVLELLHDMEKFRKISHTWNNLNKTLPEPHWRKCTQKPPPEYITEEEDWN